MNPKVLGYQKEDTEGTDPIVVGTAVTRFGNESYDRPHPWHTNELIPSFKEGQLVAGKMQKGMNRLEFDILTNFVHAGIIDFAVGKVTDLGGNSSRMEFGDPGDIDSMTVYSQVGTDIVANKGCKVEKYDLDVVLNDYVRQGVSLMGWASALRAAITADPPAVHPASLVNEDSKGFEQVVDKEYNDIDQPNLREVHVSIQNRLDVHGGLGSRVPRGIEQLEGSLLRIGYLVTLDGTTDDLLSVLRDQELSFEPGDTNDFEFTLEFDNHLGAGVKTYVFQFHNVFLTEPVPLVPKERIAEYAILGWAIDDGTNKPFSLITDDGVDYSVL